MTTSIRQTSIALRGAYDLREVGLMSFGPRDEANWDGTMRLAFVADDLENPVGVAVTQTGDALQLEVHGDGDLAAIAAQVARVVSADHDGDAWARVCAADPVLSRVYAAAPGFRPANFHSPYEAAVWSVLSARRSRAQGIALRRRFAEEFGTVFDLAGRSEAALPAPAALLEVDGFPGLPADRIPRLHGIAAAALEGRLAVERLAAMEPADAMIDLQRLPGIGPFYSALIYVRACGLTDVLSTEAAHTRDAIVRLYGLDADPTDGEIAVLAESWRPFRTWAAVALRAVGERL